MYNEKISKIWLSDLDETNNNKICSTTQIFKVIIISIINQGLSLIKSIQGEIKDNFENSWNIWLNWL